MIPKMQRLKIFISLVFISLKGIGQPAYDSITISYFVGEQVLGASKVMSTNWTDSLKMGQFKNWLRAEKTIYVKPPGKIRANHPFFILTNRIKTNGTADISKCFIPRHSINYYKNGNINLFLLVCFECDGLRFSNEPEKRFVKSILVRDRQMKDIKKLFNNYKL